MENLSLKHYILLLAGDVSKWGKGRYLWKMKDARYWMLVRSDKKNAGQENKTSHSFFARRALFVELRSD